MTRLNAYLANSYRKPADLAALAPEELANALNYTNHNMENTPGWVLVGHADVTVTLMPPDDLIAKQADALREQIRQHRAESQMKLMRLESDLQKLLAITCEVAA